MPRAFWPGEDPIGQVDPDRVADRARRRAPGYSEVTVVGTVGDVISGMLFDGPEPGTSTCRRRRAPARRRAARRGRSPARSRPPAAAGILGRAAPDPEVFEALPLEEVRDAQIYPFLAASWIGSLRSGVIALGVERLRPVRRADLHADAAHEGDRHPDGARRDRGHGRALVMGQTAWLTGIGAHRRTRWAHSAC